MPCHGVIFFMFLVLGLMEVLGSVGFLAFMKFGIFLASNSSEFLFSISRSLIWVFLIFSMSLLNARHLSFSFLNRWNMIVVTMLMSLLANSVICSSESVSTDLFFPPHCGSFFLLLSMSRNFCLDVKCCEFYSVGCWIFLYFYDYSWRCFGALLGYLETICSFKGLSLSFVSWDQNSL